jgi:hypothetical protein
MADPTLSQQIINALEANQAALNALLEQNATSGEWAARGDIYLNGYAIRGGHPDVPETDRTIRLAGGAIELIPGMDGSSTVRGIRTPQPIRRELTSSATLTETDNGSLFIAQHAAADSEIVLTLPGLPVDYGADAESTTVIFGATYFVQVFHAGDGVLSFAVPSTNEFLIAGVSSSDPITVDPGTGALAIYVGAGQWSVF